MSHALVLAAVAATVLTGVVPAQGGDPSAPGSYEVLGTVVRFERGPDGPAYRYSEDGGRGFSAARAVEPVLKLVYADFDPLVAEPQVPGLLAARAEGRLFAVQYHTVELEAYRRALRALGVELHQMLPFQGALLRMDPALRAKVAALPFVRWVGPYQPAWRLEVASARSSAASATASRRGPTTSSWSTATATATASPARSSRPPAGSPPTRSGTCT
ncbi:MAG: hypothetical protein R3F30_04325 [Planctomycetota bacterium]